MNHWLGMIYLTFNFLPLWNLHCIEIISGGSVYDIKRDTVIGGIGDGDDVGDDIGGSRDRDDDDDGGDGDVCDGNGVSCAEDINYDDNDDEVMLITVMTAVVAFMLIINVKNNRSLYR